MNRTFGSRIGGLATAVAIALAGIPAHASQPPVTSVYSAYESLIGVWDIRAAEGTQPIAVERFTWGPGRSYIWFSTALIVGGREEPHFEGMLVWNGVNRNLDMLAVLDLAGGRVQEQGTLSVLPDGTLSRDIVGIYSPGTRMPSGATVGPEGARMNFRQTFRLLRPDRMMTGLTRQGNAGWEESFPGSANLVLTRRSEGVAPGTGR